MKITQSFIKQFKKYLSGELCGNIIKHSWVDGQLIPGSKAMKVGTYFEFQLSGALPKDKMVPLPEYMKSGKEMMEPYRKAFNDAKFLKELLRQMGLKITKAGLKLTKGKFEGTIDLICESEKDIIGKDYTIKAGDKIVIDVKYSGLLDDKWNEMGWVFNDIQKGYHKVQAIQYHFVSGLPFFYLVTDSAHKEKDDDGNLIAPDVKLFYIPVSEFLIEQHVVEANDLETQFEFHKGVGFAARPSLGRCNKCPLKDTCPDRALFPVVELIDLNVE